MHTSFVKIIHFSRLVKIEDRLREFNFKKNNNAGDKVQMLRVWEPAE